MAGGTRLCRLKRCGNALDHGHFRIEKFLRWLAEVDGSAHRAVIAAMAAGHLEESAFVCFERPLVPGEVGVCGVDA